MFFKKLTYPTWGFITLAIILALVTNNNVGKQQTHKWKEKLQQEIVENTLILAGQLEVIERELMGIVSLFEASTVDRAGFQTYVTPLLKKHGFIHSFQWIPRVLHEHRPILESLAQRDGFRNFQFKILAKNLALMPAPPSDKYFPIYYIEPLSNNEPVLGFDIRTQPNLLSYLNQARDSGKSIASNTKVWNQFENNSKM
ncbi:MAG TPA: CHASE domain-containing protein, partial [Nitrospinaceae bacterium]|nr:CHASE domain-containing protein [Nitrospinaceae bacterium]